MLKKKFLALLAAVALACGAVGCKADTDTGQVDTEQTVQETQQTAATTTIEQNEQTVENVESLETETFAESKDNVTETVIIAGQEFSVDATAVSIDIFDNSEPVTDISVLDEFVNLKSININYFTDGGYNRRVDGLKVFEGNENIESFSSRVGFLDDDDIYVFETMPNLKSLSLYSVYEDFGFDIPSLKELYLLGTYDLSKIEHLTELESLSLEYNNGKDLSPITKLKNLRYLYICECFFEDYSSILELENLENLWISSYPMTEEMYNKICEKFPNCKITIINDFID